MKLTEMEARGGVGYPTNLPENFRNQSSLIDFQEGLGVNEILLSFYLGGEQSYLWAVTREAVSLHRLPGAARIREAIGAFRSAVLKGNKPAEEQGQRLYRDLFGDLSVEETRKQAWLLSIDDALFELPFAALVAKRGGGKVEYLVEKHSMRVILGALPSSGLPGKQDANGWFLGVADPIYNTADPRWADTRGGPGFQAWFRQPTGTQLNRLVASGREIESSARSWNGNAVLLTGTEARRGPFLNAQTREVQGRGPAIIHLATHVVTPPARRGESLIALGLDSFNEPEVLTTSEIGMLRVQGALVTMTGCASGLGEFRPGAGLLGLARAWEMAGARAVVATQWPVRDSKGEIFSSFYRNLRTAPAEEALRLSQLEMISSDTWRASPAYWASFQVTGGSQ